MNLIRICISILLWNVNANKGMTFNNGIYIDLIRILWQNKRNKEKFNNCCY